MFGLDFIRKLKPCKWRYTDKLDDGVEHFGFVAQDVNELADHREYGFVVLMDNGYFGLSMSEFIGPIVKAIQELDEKLAQLQEDLPREVRKTILKDLTSRTAIKNIEGRKGI